MKDKTLYVHISDEEYLRRFIRYMNMRRHPELAVERITEREMFWQRVNEDNGNEDDYYLTDNMINIPDISLNGTGSRIMYLSDTDDEKNRIISVCQSADLIYTMCLKIMKLSESSRGKARGPVPGIYGVCGHGEASDVVAGSLSQELSEYGNCLYISLAAFPHFYTTYKKEEHSLGELIFRIGSGEFVALVNNALTEFGRAKRLPGVSHYKDLWDMSDDDRAALLKKLKNECDFDYIVVGFNDVREMMPQVGICQKMFVVVPRDRREDIWERWLSYAGMEGVPGEELTSVYVPDEWTKWARRLDGCAPSQWLEDGELKGFITGLIREI